MMAAVLTSLFQALQSTDSNSVVTDKTADIVLGQFKATGTPFLSSKEGPPIARVCGCFVTP